MNFSGLKLSTLLVWLGARVFIFSDNNIVDNYISLCDTICVVCVVLF
ncbi:hypothetical protein M758_9G085700 [Ceratodon purpureus]|nr:hypothetical protein M758_9G085700 [Ceratodon purpureus]